MKWSRLFPPLGAAVAILCLGLVALSGAFGGGGGAPLAVPTTTSTSNVVVLLTPANTPARNVVVPNVVGESQAQATATLAAADLGTSAANETVNDGTPAGAVVVEAPWAGSYVAPGSVVSIKVANG